MHPAFNPPMITNSLAELGGEHSVVAEIASGHHVDSPILKAGVELLRLALDADQRVEMILRRFGPHTWRKVPHPATTVLDPIALPDLICAIFIRRATALSVVDHRVVER